MPELETPQIGVTPTAAALSGPSLAPPTSTGGSDGRPRWVVVSARRKELRRERRPSRRRLGVLPGAPGHRRDATVDVIRESHRRQAGEKWVHVSLDDESADTRINRLTDNDIRDNDIRRVYSTPRKPSSSTLASPTARTPPLPPSSRAIATPEGTGQGKRGCKQRGVKLPTGATGAAGVPLTR
eukprot:CAMPEP_0118915050 /NCGR_PEP_ID=MMETSP1166-20130328/15306_1 /TAXON_ID=1104430 /ORGANISM="Chrysoreinhardia sp, Strain CCMP3193" /LENGTH=182 /DNA_ID=CAMNT_0006854699 /DNA_START=349 /DNA_END=894 /DNA_ORIENTATION=+